MRVIFLMLIVFLNGSLYAQGVQKRERILVDGMKRDFVTYVPGSAMPGEKMALVISLHGGFASPEGQFKLADFRPLADRDHFIVVCPASKRVWHDGRNENGIDDVGFIEGLITYIEQTYHSDPRRVYVAGISNGGFLTSRLACELSDRIAAIGVVAATMDEEQGYHPVRPMPVMYMHGTNDHVFPDKEDEVFGRMIYSQAQVLKLWADVNQCVGPPVITKIPDHAHDGTSIVKEVYTNPATGFKVVGYTIINGGHTWPGGTQYAPQFIVGKTTKNLNACQEMWDFFKEYRLQIPPNPPRNK